MSGQEEKAQKQKPIPSPRWLWVYFALTGIEGLFAFIAAILIPSDPGHLFGYSLQRLGLFAIIAGFSLFLGGMAFKTWHNHIQAEHLSNWLTRLTSGPGFYVYVVACFLGSGLGLATLLWPGYKMPENFLAYYHRLLPAIVWGTLAALQTLALLLIWRGIPDLSQIYKKNSRPTVVSILLVFALGVWILWSRMGIERVYGFWQDPGAPILMLQAVTGWGIVVLALLGGYLLQKFFPHVSWSRYLRGNVNIYIAIIIWLVACLVWWAEPMQPTYFAPRPTAPNFEYYPNSDAALYDYIGQKVLIGEGLSNQSQTKPIYAFILAISHLVAGQDYMQVVSVQIAFLALIPALVFVLASQISDRYAGILAATLVIFREKNAIAIGHKVLVAHAKLMMSDLPALMGVLALAALSAFWLARPAQRRAWPVAVGGLLGLFMLLRNQTTLFLVLLIGVSAIVLFRRWRLWVESTLLIALGLVFSLTPLVLRNYHRTGHLVLMESAFYQEFLLDEYRQAVGIPTGDIGATEADTDTLALLRVIADHPVPFTQYVLGHFFHSQIESIVYLPGTFVLDDLLTYVKRMPFWDGWDGRLPAESIPIFILNLLIIAWGVGTAWERSRHLIWVPLSLSMGYAFSAAIAGFSGWRFILPADWISVLFYSIGLTQVARITLTPFIPVWVEDNHQGVERQGKLNWHSVMKLGLACSFVPILIWGADLIPQRYPEKDSREVFALYRTLVDDNDENLVRAKDIEVFLEQESAIAIHGRALYPRYYGRNQGLGVTTGLPQYHYKPYGRIGFQLINAQNWGVVLPLIESPASFPNASDVIVIGCDRGKTIQALIVLVRGEDTVLVRSPWPEPTCPLLEPE